ncbi:hypothetical protein BC008_05255 [Mastigocoleus testarum BC008]|uniref:Glycosyl hydrolase family 32 N-terminal domain-containing protein n=2 Tax=Mastigocoleus TaxID=996924 RepID=A0A0V7ZZ58_9CYAN|nr:hypothetical protein BC008_05025 [Mastigocoleus testarum BC008]KST69707.1 hypothetical protein BC008_05255 [Mastigocoleus testarum BC008]
MAILESLTLPTEIKKWVPFKDYAKNYVAKFVQSSQKGLPSWDPWIFKDDDIYRLFYLAGTPEVNSMCWWENSRIHGAISHNLKDWQDLGVILEPEPSNSWESGRLFTGYTYKENGVYYLFYSGAGKGWPHLMHEGIGLAKSTDSLHWERYSNGYLNPKWVEKVDGNITDSSIHWYVADEIAGPYKPVSSHPIIPSSMRTGLYASHFLPMSDNLNELLLYGWYFRFSTLEVSPNFRVKWEGDNIQIA